MIGLTLGAAIALLVIVTIISGPMPPDHTATLAPQMADSEPAADTPRSSDQEFGGNWVLVARDGVGGSVYVDRDGIRKAGTHMVADLGIVAMQGRKIERVNITCADNSATDVQAFGDDVETTANLAGDTPDGINPHSVFDYICGRAKLPSGSIDVLPAHS